MLIGVSLPARITKASRRHRFDSPRFWTGSHPAPIAAHQHDYRGRHDGHDRYRSHHQVDHGHPRTRHRPPLITTRVPALIAEDRPGNGSHPVVAADRALPGSNNSLNSAVLRQLPGTTPAGREFQGPAGADEIRVRRGCRTSGQPRCAPGAPPGDGRHRCARGPLRDRPRDPGQPSAEVSGDVRGSGAVTPSEGRPWAFGTARPNCQWALAGWAA